MRELKHGSANISLYRDGPYQGNKWYSNESEWTVLNCIGCYRLISCIWFSEPFYFIIETIYILWNQWYGIGMVAILFIWSYAECTYKWGLFQGENAWSWGTTRFGFRCKVIHSLYTTPISHIRGPSCSLSYICWWYSAYVKFDRESRSSMKIVITRLDDCLLDVSHWMTHIGLKLNNDKTEWLMFNGNPNFPKRVTLTVGAEKIK